MILINCKTNDLILLSKARRRPCSFSKDGTLDQTGQSPDIHSADRISCAEEERPYKRRSSTKSDSPIHQQSAMETRSKEQEKLRITSQQLDKLSMMWPGEGKEGRWLVDINLLFNGIEDNNNTHQRQQLSHHQPPIHINAHLLSLYFRHRYTVFPILPKCIFYRLLDNRDTFINPLLLYSMYCHSAHFSHEDASEADTYYKRAQYLLDAYIDTPSLSTVVSLCLLSLFESNRYGLGPHTGTSRARIYSDMACRMCHDLKLHKRYSFHNTGATPDDIELRKRVYWVCYCLDKVHSLVNARPFLLSSRQADLDFPMVLKTDDPSEFEINTCFVEHIKLMQISERVLRLELPDRQAGIMRLPENEQLVLDLDGQLMYWLRSLPQQLQWTPLNTDAHVIPTQPPANALIAHLHLVFNFVEISVLLQPLASITLSSSPTSLMIQQRCSTVATNLTQLTCAMSDQPDCIMSFTLVAEAIMAAVRVHIMDCADEKLNKARHARFMFQRSLRSLRSVLHHRIIDRIQEYTHTIERALADADTGNSNSRNSSPKLHVLSPIIPRTATNSSTPNTNNQPMESPSAMDDRWPARYNNSNNNGLFSYGLVSPASSTASAPVEKSTMSRNDELIRPQSHLAQSSMHPPSSEPTTTASTPTLNGNINQNTTTTTVPLIDPYSRAASFTIPTNASPISWRSPSLPTQQLSPIRNYYRTPQHEQMEMYSNIWSRSMVDADMPPFSSSSENLNHSFVDSTPQQDTTTSTETPAEAIKATETPKTMNADAEIYSLWDQPAQQTKKEEEPPTTFFTPRYGLGVYASAQQHHTDVIRQHLPGIKSNHRPVLLNHHGQVVVNNNIQP
jgi:hypothetical protein